ncbi:MAG: hypothetical protein WHT65_00820 [Pseudothermotoga sp.]
MKQVRIVYNTGQLSETGTPVLRRNVIDVEDSVAEQTASQIAQVIGALTEYTLQEAHLITTTQVF